jgi:hypothetical protein
MLNTKRGLGRRWTHLIQALLGGAMVVLAWLPTVAQAIPAFNRQTGQNCVACHAGGQFPELTAYGRMFKLTGYTIGERAIPISAMLLGSVSKVANKSKSADPAEDFQKNGTAMMATASLLAGGKVTDNVGAFVQVTYDPYAVKGDDGQFHGHSNAGNIDIRYADRFINGERDLIFGVSANNNPSVSDPWNTAAAWMQYVPVPSPSSSRFIDGNAPYPGFGAGGNLAGITAYGFWNRTIYAELGGYRSATKALAFMSAGIPDADTTKLRGTNPYWRLAYNREWGAHSLMLGTSGMVARVYDDNLDTSDPSTVHRNKDMGLDAQYQYLLDPHSITAQVAYMRNQTRNSAADASPNETNTVKVLRGKMTYVYQAKYGGSLGFFNQSGNDNAANIVTDPAEQVDGNLTGSPAIRGWTLEAFWTPIQYLRVGAQYTLYSRFNGARSNYNGLGRNASDNNTLFLYTWLAY